MSIKLTLQSPDPVAKYAPLSEKATLHTYPRNQNILLNMDILLVCIDANSREQIYW